MHRKRWMFWASAGQLLLAGLAVTGCATTPSVQDDEASQEVRDHHRHHHHGGVVAFIALSIDSLGLPPEKKEQVEKIEADLAKQLAPGRAAEQALLSTLADGVAAGTIDEAKVNTELEQLDAAATNVHAASEDALNRLHAVLSPAERQVLVDKVRAHWGVWRHVNEESPDSTDSHLARITKELDLSSDQVSRIQQALESLPPPEQVSASTAQAHIDDFSRAFAADTFDAASLGMANTANAHIAKFGAARTAHFYETVTPVLTPEQRTKLADHLRKHLIQQAS